MKPDTPQAWLWTEIEKRIGKDEAAALYQEWLAEMRRYNRRKTGSTLPADAPRRPNGRKAGKVG